MNMFNSEKEECYSSNQISRYYNITPIGIGTSLIESLSSYLIRLADAHSITLASFVGKEITPLLNKHYLNKVAERGGAGIYKSASSLNGINLNADNLIKLLEDLTQRNDLSSLTFFKFTNVLPTRGLLREHKAWCSNCLEEWSNKRNSIYEPLLWFFKEVVICPIHNCYLKTTCPSCLKEIPTLTRRTRHGYCSYCSKWLVHNTNDISSVKEEVISWDLWRAKAISEFLKTLPFINRPPEKNRINIVIKKVLQECAGGEYKRLSKVMDTPTSTIHSWIRENKSPSFPYLLRICYCSGISLRQLLVDELSNVQLKPRLFNFTSNFKSNSKQRFPKGYIEKQLHLYLKDNLVPPKSIKEIANIIGCDRKLLYKADVNTCKKISKKYLDYINKRAKVRIESNKIQVIKAVNILINEGVYPSRRKIEEYLNMPGLIKEEAIRIVWKQEIDKWRI